MSHAPKVGPNLVYGKRAMKARGLNQNQNMKKLSTVIHRPRFVVRILAALAAAVYLPATVDAAGVLTPIDSSQAPIEIRDHHVSVVINNGFAQTRVTQTFYNPNEVDLEAVYAFPVPEKGSLSEMRMISGETILEGEVIARTEAERIYQEEKSRGNETGLATKESYQRFTFKLYPVRAKAECRMEIVYYQPIDIDSGIGRYVYPLEEGGTDEVQKSFWLNNDVVTGSFSADITLRCSYPLKEIRVPNFEGQPIRDEEGSWHWSYSSAGGSLAEDLVLYYRLADDLPGRVDVLPYKAAGASEGTFMMVVTPGIDLEPITTGADYVFILDKSGSMSAKIQTLITGVEEALIELDDHDRYRIIAFDNNARELTRSWTPATPENVAATVLKLRQVSAGNSTNIYAGLQQAIKSLDADRPTNVILVTDGVTNEGIVDPARFYELLKNQDLRLFGFLMGNSANWPLMRTICEATDGFYTAVSTSDDVLGKILQAKEKIVYESLLNVDFKIKGVRTFNVTRDFRGKIFRGQQLVLFGRYAGGGSAELTLEATKTGEDKTYRTTIELPSLDERFPEIERLWALSKIEEIELQRDIGKMKETESKSAIADLGVDYQLVTDETAMIVLDSSSFQRHGIERRNEKRMATEYAAQSARGNQPVQQTRVDQEQPMFDRKAPTLGGGGGALPGPVVLLMMVGLMPLWLLGRRGKKL